MPPLDINLKVSSNESYLDHREAPPSPFPAVLLGEYMITFVSGVFRDAEKP